MVFKKGETWEQRMGKEKSDILKEKYRNRIKNNNPMHNQDARKKMSENNKGKHNQLKGKSWEELMSKEKSEERKKKISIIMKNRDAYWMKGENNPMRRPEIAKKVSDKLKGKESKLKGKKWDDIIKNKESIQNRKLDIKNRQLTNNTSKTITARKKISDYMKNNPPCFDKEFYLEHGYKRSSEPYTDEFNDEIKKKISERDFCTCQLCTELLPDKFAIHHIDYDKKNSNENNLIFLCGHCHSKTNHNREFWKSYFESYQKERGYENA